MKQTAIVVRSALAGLVALGLAGPAGLALAADEPEMEKCAGIAKASKNDCKTSAHSCSGQATADGDPEEWIYLPKGTCDRIVGATLVE